MMDEEHKEDNPYLNIGGLFDEIHERLFKSLYTSQKPPDPNEWDMLWACYYLETAEYDRWIELIAEAQHRPVTSDEWGKMNHHALLCRKAITEIAQGAPLTSNYTSRHYDRWKIADLQRLVLGTESYELFKKIKARIVEQDRYSRGKPE